MLLATTGKDTHTPRECLLRGVCVFAVCLSLAKTLGVCLAKTLSVCGGLSVGECVAKTPEPCFMCICESVIVFVCV